MEKLHSNLDVTGKGHGYRKVKMGTSTANPSLCIYIYKTGI
jgi:hypothetical protein